MAFPDLTYRDLLDPATRLELEQLFALVNGFLGAEHKEDGSHSAISADSATLTGAVDVGGALTVTGTGAFDGNVTADADDKTVVMGANLGTVVNNGTTGSGIQINAEGTLGTVGDWAIVADSSAGPLGGGTNNRALSIVDVSSGEQPLIVWRQGSTNYHISPDLNTNSTIPVNVGDVQQTNGHGRFDRVYAKGLDVGTTTSDNSAAGVISASVGYRERGRTTALGDWAAFTPTWTNLTVGNGSVVARHTKIGDTVHFRIELVFGTTTSISGAVSVTVPSTMQSANSIDGDVVMVDQGVGFYAGDITPNSTTVIDLVDNGSPVASVTSTNPFTFGSTDVILIYGTYEEA